jgi:antitoxin HigA-1
MTKTRRPQRLHPVHPGEVLKEELLIPLRMSVSQLARDLKVPVNRLTQIVNGQRAVTPDTSLRLARYFGFSPSYWMNLQTQFEMDVARQERLKQIEREVVPRAAA